MLSYIGYKIVNSNENDNIEKYNKISNISNDIMNFQFQIEDQMVFLFHTKDLKNVNNIEEKYKDLLASQEELILKMSALVNEQNKSYWEKYLLERKTLVQSSEKIFESRKNNIDFPVDEHSVQSLNVNSQMRDFNKINYELMEGVIFQNIQNTSELNKYIIGAFSLIGIISIFSYFLILGTLKSNNKEVIANFNESMSKIENLSKKESKMPSNQNVSPENIALYEANLKIKDLTNKIEIYNNALLGMVENSEGNATALIKTFSKETMQPRKNIGQVKKLEKIVPVKEKVISKIEPKIKKVQEKLTMNKIPSYDHAGFEDV